MNHQQQTNWARALELTRKIDRELKQYDPDLILSASWSEERFALLQTILDQTGADLDNLRWDLERILEQLNILESIILEKKKSTKQEFGTIKVRKEVAKAYRDNR